MPMWSASSSWQRRPCGPSATLTDSRPSLGMPLSCQKLRPEHSDAACGDSVIVSEAACGACDSDARACVQHHPSPQPVRPGCGVSGTCCTQEAGTRELLRTVHKGPSLREVHVNAARRPPPGSSGPPGPPQARQAPRASRAHPDPAEQATWVGPRRRQVASSRWRGEWRAVLVEFSIHNRCIVIRGKLRVSARTRTFTFFRIPFMIQLLELQSPPRGPLVAHRWLLTPLDLQLD